MKTTRIDYTPIQLKFPVGIEKIIKVNDPVYSFREVMAHIDPEKYFVAEKGREMGRPRYDREKLLKIVLFAFMENGYCSVRQIHKLCETDIRFLWLLDEEEAPSHMTISNFIHSVPGDQRRSGARIHRRNKTGSQRQQIHMGVEEKLYQEQEYYLYKDKYSSA